ncbi:MAG: acyltransferase family protein [Oscillospiraceae bacterium]|jgi:peptidoglycan/LPS O-acetylase OafA/YrhL|nr:acyltransferase family protein [Oscillospiraceae bacterium]
MQLKKASADTSDSPAVRPNKKLRRNGGIELWRFVFASFVVFYHFELMLGNLYMLPMGYKRLAQVGFIGVEFFFILAGFMLMRRDTEQRRAGLPAGGTTLPYPERMSLAESGHAAKNYVLARLRVIYPTLIAVLILFTLVFFMPGMDGKPRLKVIMDLDQELLLLGGTSFGWGDITNPAPFLIVT